MSQTNDFKDKHLDQFYDWVADNKYEQALDYCQPTTLHADDDSERIIEIFIEACEDQLWPEYISTLPEA
jgi:hypothetical protein